MNRSHDDIIAALQLLLADTDPKERCFLYRAAFQDSLVVLQVTDSLRFAHDFNKTVEILRRALEHIVSIENGEDTVPAGAKATHLSIFQAIQYLKASAATLGIAIDSPAGKS